MASKEEIDEVAEALRRKRPPIRAKDLLGSGSTLFNCSATDHPAGAYVKGRMHWLIGDSAAGKTVFGMAAFAEACLNRTFDDYRLIYDPTERGNLIDIRKHYGNAAADRIEPPGYDDKGDPRYSYTVEECFFNIDDAIKDGRPFLYIVDSLDGLSSNVEEDRFEVRKEADRAGKETAGDYGDGKAVAFSRGLRRVIPKLEQSTSILILISQTRDNIGRDAMFNPRRVAGGRALRFYCRLEAWFSVAKHHKKTHKGKELETGVVSRIALKKNSFTGKLRTTEVDIYHSSGIDDVGSCIDFLCDWKHWRGGTTIEAPEFGLSGSRERLIQAIEAGNHEIELRKLVGKAWAEIEAAVAVPRKPRYG